MKLERFLVIIFLIISSVTLLFSLISNFLLDTNLYQVLKDFISPIVALFGISFGVYSLEKQFKNMRDVQKKDFDYQAKVNFYGQISKIIEGYMIKVQDHIFQINNALLSSKENIEKSHELLLVFKDIQHAFIKLRPKLHSYHIFNPELIQTYSLIIDYVITKARYEMLVYDRLEKTSDNNKKFADELMKYVQSTIVYTRHFSSLMQNHSFSEVYSFKLEYINNNIKTKYKLTDDILELNSLYSKVNDDISELHEKIENLG